MTLEKKKKKNLTFRCRFRFDIVSSSLAQFTWKLVFLSRVTQLTERSRLGLYRLMMQSATEVSKLSVAPFILFYDINTNEDSDAV